jgi:hypothetical protein
MIDSAKEVLLSDPLSVQTRKERQLLLLVSLFSLALTKAGLLPQKISALGIEFKLANQQALLLIVLLIVVYFILALTIYAASDFIAWRKSVVAYSSENVKKFFNDVKEALKEREKEQEDHEIILRDLEAKMRFWRGKAWTTSIIRSVFEFFLPLLVGAYAIWSLLVTVNSLPATEISATQSTYREKINIDLSTPEKAIDLFVKSFRVGDDSMLSAVLTPHAAIPEFNPLQKIECPSPQITGFDIKKSHVVTDKEQIVSDSIPGDIEAHVALKIDKNLINKKCAISLWEKGVYVLRNSTSGWHIVSVIPFWPEEVKNHTK